MVIEPERWADWLDPANNDPADLQALLAPAAAGGLASYPVSTAVNSVRNNGPELLERIDQARSARTRAPARPAPVDPGALASQGTSGSVPDKLF